MDCSWTRGFEGSLSWFGEFCYRRYQLLLTVSSVCYDDDDDEKEMDIFFFFFFCSADIFFTFEKQNAFANHGFLPHNGYATVTQFIEATNSVVGMGVQLAAFLAVLGAGIDGDGISWSIHGTPPPGVGGPLSGFGHGYVEIFLMD